jgi:hypothetical protein
MSCLLFHKWSKWQDSLGTIEMGYSPFYPDKQGETFEAEIQTRRCLRCNKFKWRRK